MSGESTDSESFPSDTNQRSRSLLRQVQASISGKSTLRNSPNVNRESPSVLLLRHKRRSFEHIDLYKPRRKSSSRPATPNSFSHHLSLLNQVKSHFLRTPKYRRAKPNPWNDEDDYHSIPSIISTTVSLLTRYF